MKNRTAIAIGAAVGIGALVIYSNDKKKLNAQIQSVDAQIAVDTKQVGTGQSALTYEQSNVKDVASQLKSQSQLQNQYQGAQSQLSQVTQQYSQQNQQTQQIQAKLGNLTQLQSQLQQLQQKLSQTTQQYTQTQQQYQSLKSQMSDLNSLQSQVSSLQSQLSAMSS